MVTKIRKQIYIEPAQDFILKRLAEETGQSEAELIRQAINHHAQLVQHPRPDIAAWTAEKAFIEQLMAQGELPDGRTWQREDLYER